MKTNEGTWRHTFLLGLFNFRNSQLKTCDEKEEELHYMCCGKEADLYTHINGSQVSIKHNMGYLSYHGDEDAGDTASANSLQGMKA
jgi:hypothetical protein